MPTGNTGKAVPPGLTPWKPGQSGNPSGRPAVNRDFVARCRDFMEKSGWKNIETIAKDPAHQHFMRATELLAAYAYGKPSQAVEHAGEVNLTVVFKERRRIPNA